MTAWCDHNVGLGWLNCVTGDMYPHISRPGASLGAGDAASEWLGQLGGGVWRQPHVPLHPGHQCAAPADSGGGQHCACGSQCPVSPRQSHFWHQSGESYVLCWTFVGPWHGSDTSLAVTKAARLCTFDVPPWCAFSAGPLLPSICVVNTAIVCIKRHINSLATAPQSFKLM